MPSPAHCALKVCFVGFYSCKKSLKRGWHDIRDQCEFSNIPEIFCIKMVSIFFFPPRNNTLNVMILNSLSTVPVHSSTVTEVGYFWDIIWSTWRIFIYLLSYAKKKKRQQENSLYKNPFQLHSLHLWP